MIQTIREVINDYTGLYIVDTDSNSSKPDYPYYSYKLISMDLAPKQTGAVDENVMTLDSNYIISFNSYSDNLNVARESIIKLWELFKFTARHVLSLENIIVVNLTNIQDRTIYIVENFEYRFGFDVEIRKIKTIKRDVETIETYKVEGGIK